jgi:hypothetical protein
MKSVIIIYIPCQTEPNKLALDENLKKLKDSDLHQGFDIFYIEEPGRTEIKVEVFFNPYQK